MIYREVLSYMAERSGIPLWIVDEQAEIRFSTIDDSRFGDRKNMRKFFSSFVGSGTAPRVKKFDTHELYGSFPFEDEAGGGTLIWSRDRRMKSTPMREDGKALAAYYFIQTASKRFF